MNNILHTSHYHQIKDKLLYDLAPILAKHYSSLLNGEDAYEIADLTVNFIDSTVASVIKK